MGKTKAAELNEFGQSVWIDNISRAMLASGKLKQMIDAGVRGLTSNPTIFEKSIGTGSDYDTQIAALLSAGKSTFAIYDDLTVKDIQDAADMFMPVYQQSNGTDGYVSLEINPQLAAKAKETIEEGRRLHGKVDRPNLMLKVPATDAGFEAIEELLAEGISINATLIFSLSQYMRTAQAYIKGIARLLEKTGEANSTSSVASVFVSRIDTVIDKRLAGLTEQQSDPSRRRAVEHLKGKAAVANSRNIYEKYTEIYAGPEFEKLKQHGARAQRVLWGSTSTKNPAYNDIKYVTELIAKGTVNTMPEQTLTAYQDHGSVKNAFTYDVAESQAITDALQGFGIDINQVCTQLQADGVTAFQKSFTSLLQTIEEKTKKLCIK